VFPFPTGLRQVLNVYRIVSQGGELHEAFLEVAEHRGVTPNTVRSACTRNLCLTTAEFQELSRPENADLFRDFIIARFPLLRLPLESELQRLEEEKGPRIRKPGRTRPVLGKGYMLSQLNKWTSHPGIPKDLKTDMLEMIDRLESG
jgi:hypothetical protein